MKKMNFKIIRIISWIALGISLVAIGLVITLVANDQIKTALTTSINNNQNKLCAYYDIGDSYKIIGQVMAQDKKIGIQNFDINFNGRITDKRETPDSTIYYLEEHKAINQQDSLEFNMKPRVAVNRKDCSTHFFGNYADRNVPVSKKKNKKTPGIKWNQPYSSFTAEVNLLLNGNIEKTILENASTHGCLDEQSLILTEGYKLVPVYKLIPGETLINPITKAPVKIKEIIRGKHDPDMYQISLGKQKVLLTSNHPVLTSTGLKTADQLTTKDKVVQPAGKQNIITNLEVIKGDRNRDVYNIVLDTESTKTEDHYILANGIVVGDQYLQDVLAGNAQKH